MKLIILTAILLLATPVTAADFQKGAAAYNSGDYATALKEWRPLAEQGHARGQFNLGRSYYDGHGVPQDYAAAVGWYRKAAEQGHVRGQSNLGVMYDRGHGVPQDYVQAHKWFNIAATQGYKLALKNRDIIARRMTPAQIAEAQKLAREWSARRSKK